MEKPAETEYPIHDLLSRRWSPVAFSAQPVSHDVLNRLFEAARWAASSSNEQPWRYILGVKSLDPAQFDKLASVLRNNDWAKAAPVLALSVARLHFSKGDAVNRVALHDVGMATANLIVEATFEGLFVHQMAGFDVDIARSIFSIPDGFDPVAMIALGYPGDPESLNEKLKGREYSKRTRRPIEEFVFRGNFKNN